MSAKFRTTIALLIAVGLSLTGQYVRAHALLDAGDVQAVQVVADSEFDVENFAHESVTPDDN